MTIAFAGLSLASCDKELKEETAMEVGVVTDSNVSFDGKTVTVKKGNPVTFSFDGDPDFISFFSGEIGHEYKHRNRIEMQPEDVEKCEYCNGIGYIKRIPILEYIIMTDELRDLFMDSNIKYTEIASILKHCKFKNMWQKTFNYIKDGKVDLGEAISTVSNKTAVDNIIKYIQKEV